MEISWKLCGYIFCYMDNLFDCMVIAHVMEKDIYAFAYTFVNMR